MAQTVRSRDYVDRVRSLRERVRRLEVRKQPPSSLVLPTWVDLEPAPPWTSDGAQMYVDLGRCFLRGRIWMSAGGDPHAPIKDAGHLLPEPYRPVVAQVKALMQDPSADPDYPTTMGGRDDLALLFTNVNTDGTWQLRADEAARVTSVPDVWYLLDNVSWRVD